MHEIHVSERRSFRGCRRRWNWAYRDGYVPIQQAKPLEFGVAYHKAMETFYTPETWDDTTPQKKASNAISLFTLECEAQRARYKLANELNTLPQEVEDDYNERIDLAVGMMAYHANYVHPNFDQWFHPIATEVSFAVPISNPDRPDVPLRCFNSPSCGQNHSNDSYSKDSQVVYAGRVDMLVEDILYGGYFIWDHKTATQLATDDGFLQLDDQVGSYAWALSNQLNLDVKGFIYAESRKDYPKPPKLLKRSMGSRQFSTAQNQATSIEIFEPYVKENDPVAYEEGRYDDYIAYLKSAEATQYHQRFVIVKSPNELENIGYNISLEAADMVDPDLRIYPSVGRYTCSTCAYRQPCLSKFMDEDTEYLLHENYIKTGHRYWQDSSSNSDKSRK